MFYNGIPGRIFSITLQSLPVSKRKIVFLNFNGKGWGDNPKYIAEEILRQHLPYDLVWITDDKEDTFPKGVRTVPWGSRRARYELATAKVIINNVKNGPWFEKKNKQYYIQTWHGDFPLKFIEKEVESLLTPSYVNASRRDSTQIDLLLSGSRLFSNIARESFWYDGEILEKGIPRYDVYFKDTQEVPRQVRNQLNIGKDTRIALLAPTFRDNGEMPPIPDTLRLLQALEEKTREPWVVIIRLHPNIQERASLFTFSDKILDGSTYPDSQDLTVTADLLISDYSSIMYDFGLMHKPVILYIPDEEEYRKQRGLRPIFDSLPFPKGLNDQQLSEIIQNFDKEKYSVDLTTFLQEKVQSFHDGHASESVVERIKKVISGKWKLGN